MSLEPKHYEPPPPMSGWWIVALLVTVSGLVAYGLIDQALNAGKPAKTAAPAKATTGETDWDEVRQQYRLDEEATARSRESAARAAARAKEAETRREAELRQKLLDAHKANVEACIEQRAKFLPGLLPSPLAKSKIAADCAEREARMEQAGQLPPLPTP